MQRFFSLLLAGLSLALAGAPLAAAEEPSAPTDKVVYHVDETANARWALMLARGHLEEVPDAKIVFVTYGPGIDFLLREAKDRRDNLYKFAVEDLIAQGVEFRVCRNTLSAREIPRERLLEDVQVVPSGTIEIVRLQTREGFAYLKP